jgi:hypothetical protein
MKAFWANARTRDCAVRASIGNIASLGPARAASRIKQREHGRLPARWTELRKWGWRSRLSKIHASDSSMGSRAVVFDGPKTMRLTTAAAHQSPFP